MADRVMVTGGAGFVGLHLVRRLIADGAEVTVVDDFSRGRADRDLATLAGSFRLVRHDLTRRVPDGLLGDGFAAVYHLAAVVGVQRTEQEPARVLHTNVLATVNLLDWCDRHPPGAVFLSSTSEVADTAAAVGLASWPTLEDAPFVLTDLSRPRSSYAMSKAVSEAMLLLRSPPYRVRIGRYYNLYGPRMGSAHVIPQFIERIAAGVDPFPIYGAHQFRAFCYVDDAVAATVGLMGLAAPEPLVVNIGNDTEETEIIDLARRLFGLAGVVPEVTILPPPQGSPQRRLPDLHRLRSRLPDLPVTSLATGLRATFDWYAA